MERLTINTPTGAALKLNNPQTEQKAKEQLMAAYKVAVDKLAAYEDAEEQRRLILLPVPIGEPIYAIAEYTEESGEEVREIEGLNLSGYIKEGTREFYTTYGDAGSCDIEVEAAFATPGEAEAALNKKG